MILMMIHTLRPYVVLVLDWACHSKSAIFYIFVIKMIQSGGKHIGMEKNWEACWPVLSPAETTNSTGMIIAKLREVIAVVEVSVDGQVAPKRTVKSVSD
jgi:hypothetical protein